MIGYIAFPLCRLNLHLYSFNQVAACIDSLYLEVTSQLATSAWSGKLFYPTAVVPHCFKLELCTCFLVEWVRTRTQQAVKAVCGLTGKFFQLCLRGWSATLVTLCEESLIKFTSVPQRFSEQQFVSMKNRNGDIFGPKLQLVFFQCSEFILLSCLICAGHYMDTRCDLCQINVNEVSSFIFFPFRWFDVRLTLRQINRQPSHST